MNPHLFQEVTTSVYLTAVLYSLFSVCLMDLGVVFSGFPCGGMSVAVVISLWSLSAFISAILLRHNLVGETVEVPFAVKNGSVEVCKLIMLLGSMRIGRTWGLSKS